MIADLIGYATLDRAEVIARARACGRYEQVRRPLVIPDPHSPVVVQTRSGLRSTVKVSNLDADERRRLLIDGPDGLTPAAFWLSEFGTPSRSRPGKTCSQSPTHGVVEQEFL